MDNQTKVSVLVPARNEEKFIAGCLESILANDYPHSGLEILVIDGMSADRTREIVNGYARRYPFIRLVENPQRIIPAALNVGIRESRGEIIVRMDAHTTYESDYIRQAVEALETSGAAMVGALQKPTGNTPNTRAIAVATSSRFGIGNSYSRYGNESRWVEDTVFLGTWYKKTLADLGGFNEFWQINEDAELNYRLRQAGGKVLLSVKLRCTYYVRSSFRALARQYFRYGMWRAKTLLIHPSSLRWRQLAPPALVAGLLVSLGLVRSFPVLALVTPSTYLLANLLVSGAICARRGPEYLLVPLAFCVIHLSWGTGFLVGLARFSAARWRKGRKLAHASAQAD